MNFDHSEQLTDIHKSASENIKRLSVRVLQLESLVTIQSEIINYLSKNGNIDGDHPLIKISKRIQKSLVPVIADDTLSCINKDCQNVSDSRFLSFNVLL